MTHYEYIVDFWRKRKACQTVMNRIMKLNKNIQEGDYIRGLQHSRYFRYPYDNDYLTLAELHRRGFDISKIHKDFIYHSGKRKYVSRSSACYFLKADVEEWN